MLNGPEHLLPIPTGGPRWTDGGKGDADGWSKRRGDRWTGHVVVTHTDRVSDMEHLEVVDIYTANVNLCKRRAENTKYFEVVLTKYC